MALEGIKALIHGNYTTPKTGRFAGMLGPWATLIAAIGLQPRSMLVRLIFVIYGLAYLTSGIAFAMKLPFAGLGVLIFAILGLWYVPFGTLANLIVIVLLLL